MKKLYAGIDSGNSKTAFACVTSDGTVVSSGLAAASNYQTLGRAGCLARLRALVAPLKDVLSEGGHVMEGFGFGLAGLDRPRDLAVLDSIVKDLLLELCVSDAPLPPTIILNDAFLSLRAGTEDGVGVAVSAGTSGNCVGMNGDGVRVQIGGIAAELGDGGGGFDIALAGLRAAGRARDGRAPATMISDLYMQALGIADIADVVDFMIPGNTPPDIPAGMQPIPMDIEQPIPPMIGMLAPLVFQAAANGDIVAHDILSGFGRDLGVAARVAAFRLGFGPDDSFRLVLGGSVLQKAIDQTFRNALVQEVSSMYPEVKVHTLVEPPLAGALVYAFDAAGVGVAPAVRTKISEVAGGLFA